MAKRVVSFSVRAGCLAALAALPVAIAPPARAEFGAPFLVSGLRAEQPLPQVAINADGHAAFAWRGASGSIVGRVRSAAGVLGPMRILSTPGANDPPQVAVDPGGNAVGAWSVPTGITYQVQTRTLSAAGALGSTQTLSPDGVIGSKPQVALDAEGDAVAAWLQESGGSLRVQARARSAAGVLGPVKTLSYASQFAFNPQLAVDAEGDALVTWFNATTFRLQARTLSAAGVPGPIRNLSAPGTGALHQVAVDADGDALVTWVRHDGANDRVQARALSAAGSPGPVVTLSHAGSNARNSHIAMNADGDALFTWERYDGTSWRIQSRTRSETGALGPVQNISNAGQDATWPQVAVDADGDAVFVWLYWDGANNRVQARFRSKAGVFSAIQTISPAGLNAHSPQVAIGANGDAVVAWQQLSGGAYRVVAAATP
jgi:hypothetical protein